MGSLYSADISLLLKISELAKRYGMRPSEANARIDYLREDNEDREHYYHELSFEGTVTAKQEKFDQLMDALGCDEKGILKVDQFSDLEDVVDQALSLAPRPRER